VVPVADGKKEAPDEVEEIGEEEHEQREEKVRSATKALGSYLKPGSVEEEEE